MEKNADQHFSAKMLTKILLHVFSDFDDLGWWWHAD
jgi:hypothetical protein